MNSSEDTPKSETKTACRKCGAAILVMTAKRTGGYCMPHRHLGFSFPDRIGSRIELGGEVGFQEVRDEFHRTFALRAEVRDGDSKERFKVFEAAVREGGKIHSFSGRPRDNYHSIYPSRGFVLVRDGVIVAGIVIETAINHESVRQEAESLLGVGWAKGSIEEVEREVLQFELDERIPDYWSWPI